MKVASPAVPFAVAAVFLLAGCAEPAPAVPAAAPVPSATPSPSPSALPPAPAEPTTRVALDCTALADAAVLTGLIGSSVTLRAPTEHHPSLQASANAQLGTLSCLWSDGTEDDATTVANAFHLTIVPDVTDGVWAEELAPLWGRGEPRGDDPPVSCDTTSLLSCSLSDRLNGYWIQAELHGQGPAIDVAAARDTVFGSIVAAVQSLPAPGPAWRPADLAVYPAQPSCDDLVSPEEMSGILGSPITGAEWGGPSAQLAADYVPGPVLGYRSCIWDSNTGGGLGADVERLPGGAWALDPLRERWAASARETADGLLIDLGQTVSLARVRGPDLLLARVGPSPGFADRSLPELLAAVLDAASS